MQAFAPEQTQTTQVHEEYQYLNLIRDILARGTREEGRNGLTYTLFGNMMRFSLRDGTLPLLTTKRVAWRTCLKELLWFVRGETDARILQQQNVHIWDGNSTRAFLDGRGLTEYPEGILGPVYGFQWRHFGGDYVIPSSPSPSPQQLADPSENDIHVDAPENTPATTTTRQGIDQLKQVIHQLRHERNSRRILMTAWNPVDLDKMALPPCHVLAQFHVREGKYLSCALYQRSCDVGLGVPFNIASYSMLTHYLAMHCGLEAEEFVYFMGNTHIYEQHVPALLEQCQRVPEARFPKIVIHPSVQTKDVDAWSVEDLEFKDAYCHLGDLIHHMRMEA